MFIAVLSLLESGLSMFRIYTLFPFAQNNSLLGLMFSGENICFFGAIWLFVISYYETALNFEQILLSDEAELQTYDSIVKNMARKRHFNYLRWSIFAFICVLVVF